MLDNSSGLHELAIVIFSLLLTKHVGRTSSLLLLLLPDLVSLAQIGRVFITKVIDIYVLGLDFNIWVGVTVA